MRDEHADVCKCPRCSGKVVYLPTNKDFRTIPGPATHPDARWDTSVDHPVDIFSRLNPTC